MKIILFALVLAASLSASAQVVFPSIFNFGNSVQVQVHNTLPQRISCAGPVNMQTQMGRTETGYYFDQIQVGGFSMRTIYLSNMNDRISYVSHSIFCNMMP